VKVLEQGKPEWEIKVRCTGRGRLKDNSNNDIVPCEAMLLLKRSDIYFLKNPNAGFPRQYGEFVFTFKCVCCGALTDISHDDIPYIVRECIINRPKNSSQKTDDSIKKFEDEDETEELSNIDDVYYRN